VPDGEFSEDIKRQIVAMLIYDEEAWPRISGLTLVVLLKMYLGGGLG
jgi:hypothetical protein